MKNWVGLILLLVLAAPVAGRSPEYSIKEFRATGDGSTDDSAAFAAAFSSRSSPRITLPPGIYRIPCGNYFKAASAVSLVGAGQGQTIIRYDPNCRLSAELMAWDGKSRVTLRDLTIDLNTPQIPTSLTAGIVFYAYSSNAADLLIDKVAVINGSDRMFILAVAANNGFSFMNPVITNSLITLGNAGTIQNQCIAFTTVNATGSIVSPKVADNRCINSGIQYEGTRGMVARNDISGFKFGQGIFASYNDAKNEMACADTTFADNVIHDTEAGVDSNNVPFGGIENGCFTSTISGNRLYNLGGPGIANYARGATITSNRIWNNGRNGRRGAGGPCDEAGICIAVSPLGAPYDSADVRVVGNKVWDTGRGTQIYGYFEAPWFKGRAILQGNDFSGSQQQVKLSSPHTEQHR